MREAPGNITTVLSPCFNRRLCRSPLYGTLHRSPFQSHEPSDLDELYWTNLLSARPASNCRIISRDLSHRRMRCSFIVVRAADRAIRVQGPLKSRLRCVEIFPRVNGEIIRPKRDFIYRQFAMGKLHLYRA